MVAYWLGIRFIRMSCMEALLIELLVFLILGAISGFLSGMMGIGGGVIVVPGLAILFKYLVATIPHTAIMHVAAGTSLAAMVVTATMSTYHHHKRQDIEWLLWTKMLVGGVIGAIVGAYVASILHTRTLAVVFALVLLFIAINIYWKACHQEHEEKKQIIDMDIWGLSLAGFVFGIFSGMLGVGGGVLIVPFMLLLHYPMQRIVGTSVAVIVPLSIVGAIAFMITGHLSHADLKHATGYIYWPACAGVAVGSLLCVSAGTAASHHVNTRLLKKIFSVLLLLVVLEMLFT